MCDILCTLLTKCYVLIFYYVVLYKFRINKINYFEFYIFLLPMANILHSIYNKSNRLKLL